MVAIKQLKNSMVACGFQMLFDIFKAMSPQLGGPFRDLHKYVDTSIISNGEPVLLKYYL